MASAASREAARWGKQHMLPFNRLSCARAPRNGLFAAARIDFTFSERRHCRMHTLRKLLSWNFVVLSLMCLWIALSYIFQIIHRHINPLHLRSLLVHTVLPVLTAGYGAAWGPVSRVNPSGY